MKSKDIIIKTISVVDASIFDLELEKFYNMYMEMNYDVQVQYAPLFINNNISNTIRYTALVIARKRLEDGKK